MTNQQLKTIIKQLFEAECAKRKLSFASTTQQVIKDIIFTIAQDLSKIDNNDIHPLDIDVIKFEDDDYKPDISGGYL